MNATARALIFGIVVTAGLTTALDNTIAAEADAASVPNASTAAAPTTEVIRLERVVVTGHRRPA